MHGVVACQRGVSASLLSDDSTRRLLRAVENRCARPCLIDRRRLVLHPSITACRRWRLSSSETHLMRHCRRAIIFMALSPKSCLASRRERATALSLRASSTRRLTALITTTRGTVGWNRSATVSNERGPRSGSLDGDFLVTCKSLGRYRSVVGRCGAIVFRRALSGVSESVNLIER